MNSEVTVADKGVSIQMSLSNRIEQNSENYYIITTVVCY